MVQGKIWLSFAASVIGVLSVTSANAASVTTINLGTISAPVTSTGTLPNQGQVLEASFTITSTSRLSMFTDSYGGGTSVNGSTQAPGGFMPSMVLFNAAGNYVAGETFPFGNTDPVTGLKGDASITVASLSAGSYIVALSDWQVQQPPTATNLSDGFINYGSGTSFIDVQGNLRTGSYALNVSATPSASTTPEPATVWLVLPALGSVLAVIRKRHALQS